MTTPEQGGAYEQAERLADPYLDYEFYGENVQAYYGVAQTDRIGAKIMKYLSVDTEEERQKILSEPSVGFAEEDHIRFQERMGSIGKDEPAANELTTMLGRIKGPWHYEPDSAEPSLLFSRLEDSVPYQVILSVFAGGPNERRQDYQKVPSVSDLASFLAHYPDPSSFEPEAAKWLRHDLGPDNDTATLRTYEQRMREFQDIVYGKRNQYWQVMKLLWRDAHGPEMTRLPEEVAAADAFPVAPAPVAEAGANGEPFYRLSSEAGIALENRLDFHNGVYDDGNLRRTLNREDLDRARIGPKYEVKLEGGGSLFFSDLYQKDNRLAVMGFHEDEESGRIVPRTHYLSNSAASWRYLPSYNKTYAFLGDGWFDKGHGEDSLNLPAEAQRALGYLTLPGKALDVPDADLLFYGTARELSSGAGITYLAKVDPVPLVLAPQFIGQRASWGEPRAVVPPEALAFSKDDPSKPDYFITQPMEWPQRHPLLGRLVMRAYPSHDSKLQYIMGSDRDEHSFVAAVLDKQSRITSTGVSEQWVNAGDLMMPLLEYSEQTGGYGDYGRGIGNYYDMWKSYLSRVPVIREFEEALRRR